MYAVVFSNKDLKNPTQVINEVESVKLNPKGITIHSRYVQTHTQVNATVKIYDAIGNLVTPITHGQLTMLQKIKKLLKSRVKWDKD